MKKTIKKSAVKEKSLTIQEKVGIYLKKDKEYLNENRMIKRLFVNFPTRRRVPILSKIALKIVHRQGGVLDYKFYDIEALTK